VLIDFGGRYILCKINGNLGVKQMKRQHSELTETHKGRQGKSKIRRTNTMIDVHDPREKHPVVKIDGKLFFFREKNGVKEINHKTYLSTSPYWTVYTGNVEEDREEARDTVWQSQNYHRQSIYVRVQNNTEGVEVDQWVEYNKDEHGLLETFSPENVERNANKGKMQKRNQRAKKAAIGKVTAASQLEGKEKTIVGSVSSLPPEKVIKPKDADPGFSDMATEDFGGSLREAIHASKAEDIQSISEKLVNHKTFCGYLELKNLNINTEARGVALKECLKCAKVTSLNLSGLSPETKIEVLIDALKGTKVFMLTGLKPDVHSKIGAVFCHDETENANDSAVSPASTAGARSSYVSPKETCSSAASSGSGRCVSTGGMEIVGGGPSLVQDELQHSHHVNQTFSPYYPPAPTVPNMSCPSISQQANSTPATHPMASASLPPAVHPGGKISNSEGAASTSLSHLSTALDSRTPPHIR
jgi:hypothetical protein